MGHDFSLFTDRPIDSVYILIFTFVFSILFAFIGRFAFKRMRNRDDRVGDDEARIVLGAILSLLGLLIGFVLTISISGYNNRQQTEENEVMTIGSAYQSAKLLNIQDQTRAVSLLDEYLQARIRFFQSGLSDDNSLWRLRSLKIQSELWEIAVREAQAAPNPVMASVLAAFGGLYLAEQKTMASWRHQIPGAAWFLLIFFAIFSNILLGYNMRGTKGKTWLIFILPALTTLALFMIAEIDIPGEGVIHVTPDDLISLQSYLSSVSPRLPGSS